MTSMTNRKILNKNAKIKGLNGNKNRSYTNAWGTGNPKAKELRQWK